MSAPATRPAALRILVGGFALGYLLIRAQHFWSVFDLEARRWEPVGIIGWVDEPISSGLLRGALLLSIATGVAFVAGWKYRYVAPAFAFLLLFVTTARNSWGQVWHTENLLVIHVAILAFAPAAAVWAFDARGREPPPDGERYRWAPDVMTVATVVTYMLAGITKLRDSGVEWFDGDILRNQVAFDNVRKAALGADSSPIAGAVLDHGWLFAPFSWFTLAVELGAFVVFLGMGWRRVWAVSAWLFHVGVLALMAIGFPYQLSGIAFASMFPVERLGARLRPAWQPTPLPTPSPPS